MTTLTKWHGTEAEALALHLAIEHNCVCQYQEGTAERITVCIPHTAREQDQRFVDGLLWSRRIVHRLLLEEFAL